MRPGIVTPFGGPASGLWPSGTARPSPPLPIGCGTADLFADCFAGCTGVIDAGSPGPVCGWTWAGFGGSVSFTPGNMLFVGTPGQFPVGTKPLRASLAGVGNVTLQFAFTEKPPGLDTRNYEIQVLDGSGNNIIDIFFTDFGFGIGNPLDVFVGPLATAEDWFAPGGWAPTTGAHVVHLTISALLVPTLFLDGVLVPLVDGGVAGDIALGAPDSLSAAEAGSFQKIFLASGIFPPTKVFCCP